MIRHVVRGVLGTALLAACSLTVVTPEEKSSTIDVFAGADQTARVGTAVPTPPAVQVRDDGGRGVEGAAVVFTVLIGNGTVLPQVKLTDRSGVAQVTSWTLGPVAGEHKLQACMGVSGGIVRCTEFLATATP